MKRKGRKMSPWDVLAANTKQDREDAEHVQLVWQGELSLEDTRQPPTHRDGRPVGGPPIHPDHGGRPDPDGR